MTEATSTDRSVRLLPITITMPAPVVPALGEWHRWGLCVGEYPDVFFPSHGDPAIDAREICAACRVRGDCLNYATEADEFGIWGGLDQQERRNLKRKQRRRMEAASQAKNNRAEGPA
jgi:WhiB family transcriptional regulator, redox-sensing transcriptional regulator